MISYMLRCSSALRLMYIRIKMCGILLMIFPRKRLPEAVTRTQFTAALKHDGSGCLLSIVRTESLMENKAKLLHAVKLRLLHTVTRYVRPSLVYVCSIHQFTISHAGRYHLPFRFSMVRKTRPLKLLSCGLVWLSTISA